VKARCSHQIFKRRRARRERNATTYRMTRQIDEPLSGLTSVIARSCRTQDGCNGIHSSGANGLGARIRSKHCGRSESTRIGKHLGELRKQHDQQRLDLIFLSG
jgi:hypothetical protein